MQLVDRIEKRRFVGREFLLWLWFESEVFEATLSTAKHGSFGLWIERHVVLSVGVEATRIKGSSPARHREAKEALSVGKLPEAAGVHVSWGDREITFTLKAEKLALTGLALPTVLGDPGDETPALVEKRPPPRRRKKSSPGAEAERESDEQHESFYERMRLTREVEELLEALYRDFLTLRLGGAWNDTVVPALRAWVSGAPLDAARYRAKRDAALSAPKRRPPGKPSSAKSKSAVA